MQLGEVSPRDASRATLVLGAADEKEACGWVDALRVWSGTEGGGEGADEGVGETTATSESAHAAVAAYWGSHLVDDGDSDEDVSV